MRSAYSLGIAALLGSIAVTGPALAAPHHMGQTRYAAGSYKRVHGSSIATGNRHGGPHLHQREIARNARRATA